MEMMISERDGSYSRHTCEAERERERGEFLQIDISKSLALNQ